MGRKFQSVGDAERPTSDPRSSYADERDRERETENLEKRSDET